MQGIGKAPEEEQREGREGREELLLKRCLPLDKVEKQKRTKNGEGIVGCDSD